MGRYPKSPTSPYSTQEKKSAREETPAGPSSIVSQLQSLLFGHHPAKPAPKEPLEHPLSATWEPRYVKYESRDLPKDRWRNRSRLGSRTGNAADESTSRASYGVSEGGSREVVFTARHRSALEPPNQDRYTKQRKADYIAYNNMRAHVQVLTTPTADTPGTTLLLHFDNKRYLIGSLAEGTQRACVQMGARLLKVSECFITGRTEWQNTGGLIGMILTLADAASSSAAASNEEAKKRAWAKGKRLGSADDKEKMRELEEEARKETGSRLTLFSAPNLNHTLATARRFVFRKGMPVDVHEIEESRGRREGDEEWAPYWADENVKVWAMAVKPSPTQTSTRQTNGTATGTVSPRKRSFDEMHSRSPTTNGTSTVPAPDHSGDLTPSERNQLTVKAVVGEMFNSSWRLDTLYSTPLSEVKLPATLFIRNAQTNKIEKYTGPLPGSKQPIPDPHTTVLVRKPWPGALVESLPPTIPAEEAVSYIIRNHTQRGKFHPERALALKVEKGVKWNQLTSGNNVQNADGETITPDMVLGESKEGGGIAVVDIPNANYIDALLARLEWREPKVMAGVGAMVWILGRSVADDARVGEFMREFSHLQHIVSSPEYCPNNIALDSVAASTVRLRQVDPARYTVPVHSNTAPVGGGGGGLGGWVGEGGGRHSLEFSPLPSALPEGTHIAVRGQIIQLEPSLDVHTKQAIPLLDITAIESATSPAVLAEAAKALSAISSSAAETQAWAATLPPLAASAEIVTLGTGSALPSKYRNVSATLLRVPGWGNILFDCGENTLGQLKRVFPPQQLEEVLRELRMIWISHMHADHHLGTVSVIKAWYEIVHGSATPLPPATSSDLKQAGKFKEEGGLAVVSEPAMLHWLHEYASVEDFGFDRLAPIYVSLPSKHTSSPSGSRIGWFTPPSTLSSLTPSERQAHLQSMYLPPSFLNLQDIQAVPVTHCHGARAVSLTFPSPSPSTSPNAEAFKVSYSGDCRPSKAFIDIGRSSTVVIHEATFDDELQGDAEAKNHSTTSEALGVAQGMRARCVVLTHFSQRYQKLPVLERSSGDGGDEGGKVTDDVPMELPPPPPTTTTTMKGAEELEEAEGEERIESNDEVSEDGVDDVAATFPDQPTTSAGLQVSLPRPQGGPLDAHRASSAPEAVKFRLASDMKVCVAFDYMRVRVGQIAEMEKFTPALLKLFEEEEDKKPEGEVIESGKSNGKKRKEKARKGQRNN